MFTKEQLYILHRAMHSYIAYGDWKDSEQADIAEILRLILLHRGSNETNKE